MAFSLNFWKNRKRKPQRQKWKPNILVRLWQLLWCTASSAVKIAVGAVATVALIVILCVLVFAGILSELHIMFSVVMLVYYVNCISQMRIHAKTKLQLKI